VENILVERVDFELRVKVHEKVVHKSESESERVTGSQWAYQYQHSKRM